MELSEAMDRLKAQVKFCTKNVECQESDFCSDCYIEIEDVKAMEVVLNYIENKSIPKEKIRTFIDDLEYEEEIYMRNEDEVMVKELVHLQNRLQELLGDDEKCH